MATMIFRSYFVYRSDPDIDVSRGQGEWCTCCRAVLGNSCDEKPRGPLSWEAVSCGYS